MEKITNNELQSCKLHLNLLRSLTSRNEMAENIRGRTKYKFTILLGKWVKPRETTRCNVLNGGKMDVKK
jgi:hypothetical protein